MSTNILSAQTARSPGAASSEDDVRLTFPRIVTAEWIKFRTLRSTIWTLAISLIVIVGIATIFSLYLHSHLDEAGPESGGGAIALFGIGAGLAQLAVVVLGVLFITGEYGTGMIRSTLSAVPKRLPALWAKAAVLATAIFVTSTIATAISLGVMQIVLGGDGFGPDLGESETVRIVVGTPLYLTAIALFAFAIGALIRHSAGALATVLGMLLVIESLFQIPWKPLQEISPFLPGTAGSRLLMPQSQIDMMAQVSTGTVLTPWQGFAVLLAWVVVLLAGAALLLRKRDA